LLFATRADADASASGEFSSTPWQPSRLQTWQARKCFLLGATTVGRDGRLNGRSFTSRKAAARLFQISPNWRTSDGCKGRREAGLPDYTMLRFQRRSASWSNRSTRSSRLDTGRAKVRASASPSSG